MPKKINLVLDVKDFPHDEIEKQDTHIYNLVTLHDLHIQTPDGFVIMPEAYNNFIIENNLQNKIADLLTTTHYDRVDSVMQIATHIKKLIDDAYLSEELIMQLKRVYKNFYGILKNSTVLAGDKHMANNFDDLLYAIKKTWIENFDPKNLIKNKHIKSWFTIGHPILVQKIITGNKSGKLFTNQTGIDSKNLNPKEKKQIEDIRTKIKKHLFIPYEISWVIDKGKLYIVNLKPMTNAQKSHLILIRHGRSEYNEKGIWAGWDEPPLTENGVEDVKVAAATLKDIHLDFAYTSHLIRHKQTLEVLKKELDREDLPITINDAILERNYGDLTRKNKWEVEKQYGKDQFMKWRRGWEDTVPNGESLKDVYDRVVPYYKETILPKLKSGKNVIIASSGNCLRALVKYLDNISDENIPKLEIATGEVYVYQINEDGDVVNKEIRNQHENKV